MAWPDGSRFNIVNGVKWGTGPKFYPGPSADTPWNHDLNWKTYVRHAKEQDTKSAVRHMVQTPPKTGTISSLIHPGVPVYRPASGRPAGSSREPRSPTALSNAGKRMLVQATAPEMGGGSSSSQRALRTGASRGSRRAPGSAAFTPKTRREIAELKSTLSQQRQQQAVVEQRMSQLLEAVEELTRKVDGAGTA